jgi:hypothetical protein
VYRAQDGRDVKSRRRHDAAAPVAIAAQKTEWVRKADGSWYSE